MIAFLIPIVALLGLSVVAAVGAMRAGRHAPESDSGPSQAVARARLAGPATGPGPARAAVALAGPARPGPRAGVRGRRRGPDLLPVGATVSFDEERKEADLDGVLGALDRDLVGLVPIKRKVEQIASLLLVDRARNKFGLIAP